MYVVTVRFVVIARHAEQFVEAMLEQARTSRSVEPGCLQFDVCRAPDAPDRIFLYEVYSTKGDFDAHLESEHFVAFNARVAPWTIEKHVDCLERIDP